MKGTERAVLTSILSGTGTQKRSRITLWIDVAGQRLHFGRLIRSDSMSHKSNLDLVSAIVAYPIVDTPQSTRASRRPERRRADDRARAPWPWCGRQAMAHCQHVGGSTIHSGSAFSRTAPAMRPSSPAAFAPRR